MCIGVFICSHLSDKYGRKPVILTGVGLSCILCAAFGFARQYWLLVVVRFAMGFAISAQCLRVALNFLQLFLCTDAQALPEPLE